MSQRKHVEIFTDGACSGNPGPGGYGVILRYKGVNKELSDGDPSTTNNRMELSAVIAGLSALKEPCDACGRPIPEIQSITFVLQQKIIIFFAVVLLLPLEIYTFLVYNQDVLRNRMFPPTFNRCRDKFLAQ